jgi:hypothetical protein
MNAEKIQSVNALRVWRLPIILPPHNPTFAQEDKNQKSRQQKCPAMPN